MLRFSGRKYGAGGYLWNLAEVRWILFWLPEILAAVPDGKTIHVVEGEKGVPRIERAGGAATCNPGGAGKWRDEYVEVLLTRATSSSFRTETSQGAITLVRFTSPFGVAGSLFVSFSRVVGRTRPITLALGILSTSSSRSQHSHLRLIRFSVRSRFERSQRSASMTVALHSAAIWGESVGGGAACTSTKKRKRRTGPHWWPRRWRLRRRSLERIRLGRARLGRGFSPT